MVSDLIVSAVSIDYRIPKLTTVTVRMIYLIFVVSSPSSVSLNLELVPDVCSLVSTLGLTFL